MTTFVGTQDCFKTALCELLELEYDAIEAYQAATERLDNISYKTQLAEFTMDHERHVHEITSLLEVHNELAPKGPSAKQWLAKGKVILANLAGDRAILTAMLSNEMDTNDAYERMVAHPNQWMDAKAILQRAAEDERRHKAWLESTLART